MAAVFYFITLITCSWSCHYKLGLPYLPLQNFRIGILNFVNVKTEEWGGMAASYEQQLKTSSVCLLTHDEFALHTLFFGSQLFDCGIVKDNIVRWHDSADD
ncbi:hypothetical protein QQP08_014214 [Theobroma cacao]|nr:hypothetical protein QQP08_014214 [Theobroma cacao]